MSEIPKKEKKIGISGKIADMFVTSKLTPLLIITAILLGFFSVYITPKEEEPQIIVPMIDVMAPYPGASPEEVEERITTPLEKMFFGIAGVEYVYSISRPHGALITVRFKVGSPLEESLVKIHHKVMENAASRPQGAMQPMVRSYTIDDVPFYAVTLHSKELNDFSLRKTALEVERYLSEIPDISEIEVIGGRSRQVRVIPDPYKMKVKNVTLMEVMGPIMQGNVKGPVGTTKDSSPEYVVELDEFIKNAKELSQFVVGLKAGRAVYLKDVAKVIDGPEERKEYVLFGSKKGHLESAVTLSLSKRPGTNATLLAQKVQNELKSMKGSLIPGNVEFTITRDYGKTAQGKSDELIKHLLIASLSVVIFIALALGIRFSMVVGIAVPVTLALTLLIYYLFGYTLNRVTLFALIFSIGILVDDAIVVVENIQRHFKIYKKKRTFREIVVRAVNEVGDPTILATIAVIAAILPMAFVSGLMGPYMRPIPVGASIAMIFSLIVAFVVSPWAAMKMHARQAHSNDPHDEHESEGVMGRFYRKQMKRLVENRLYFAGFFILLIVLFAGSLFLVYGKAVKVKMLPFDNKSEMQIVIDKDEGSTLEETLAVAGDMGKYLKSVEEVTDYQIYAGTSAPFNFNGMVRHYFMRKAPHYADIQVNLTDKHHREKDSHPLAKEIRPQLVKIAQRHGARVKVVEIPPGPPVLSTMVAEIYGPSLEDQISLASKVKEIFENEQGVIDVDWMVEKRQEKYMLKIDRKKASLMRVNLNHVFQTVHSAFQGFNAGVFHAPSERETVPIWIQLPRKERKDISALLELNIMSMDGSLIPLKRFMSVEKDFEQRAIHHKNLKRVVYVIGDLAGSEESPVYAINSMNEKIKNLSIAGQEGLEIYSNKYPDYTDKLSMKWDGEWQITYEVFRDMGIAFALVLILIYVIVVGWFQSFIIPIVIMLPIPLSLIGIFPGHMMHGAFFTATSMIGFIAGAGIIVRNSIILVDFVELKLREGSTLKEAVIDAGAVRFRPILLTAAAVVVGAFVILFDPIFEGLAISLIYGEVVAVLLSPVAIPLLYYKMSGKSREKLLKPVNVQKNITSQEEK